MECKKIINLLDNEVIQQSKFGTKNRGEIIDDARGTYNRSRQTKLKSKTVKPSICDYSDGWIWNCEGDKKITEAGANATTVRQGNEKNKQVIHKNCALFNNCISKVNNNQVDNTKDLHIVILIYNLIQYSYDTQKHWKIYGSITKMIQMIT